MKNHKVNEMRNLDTISNGWEDYDLLDSGDQKKLEHFGPYLLNRFEPEASWKPSLSKEIWEHADGIFTIQKGKQTGSWLLKPQLPKEWGIKIRKFSLLVSISTSRHIGIFPEQLPNWLWLQSQIIESGKPLRILNLFGYTGVSTIFAAGAGAEVTHVDASRSAVRLANRNLTISGLDNYKVRWIIEDAQKFIMREIRRKNHYDGIIMDPPKFGRGPSGEIWSFEKHITKLISDCITLFSPDPIFFICTAYNVDVMPIQLGELLKTSIHTYGGKIDFGRMIQKEKSAGRKINQAIYARWSKQ